MKYIYRYFAFVTVDFKIMHLNVINSLIWIVEVYLYKYSLVLLKKKQLGDPHRLVINLKHVHDLIGSLIESQKCLTDQTNQAHLAEQFEKKL